MTCWLPAEGDPVAGQAGEREAGEREAGDRAAIDPDGVNDDARLFVAVIPPPHVLDQLERLSFEPAADLRRSTRAQWHITLRFLGRASLAASAAALGSVRAAPVDATMGAGFVWLGRGVLALPVHGLEELAVAVARATVTIGRPPENRPFRGHLTLARSRGGRRPRRVPVGTGSEAHFRVGEIHLVRSTLAPSGATYDTMVTHPLVGGASGPGG